MLTGTAMRTAMVALSSVPKMKAAAPKNLSGGAQREEVKKSGPMRSRAAHERFGHRDGDEAQHHEHERGSGESHPREDAVGPASPRAQAGLDGGHRRDTSSAER